jgi:glutaminase
LILTSLTRQEISVLAGVAEREVYGPGARIVSEGEPANALYLLVRGHVSVSVDLASGQRGYRLATLDAGVAFGESALVEDRARSANVDAESEVVCYRITSAAIKALALEYPHVRMNFLENMARDLALRLGRANREIMALAS